jgi:hypothetical protein
VVKRDIDFLHVARDCEARLAISDYGPWLELTKRVPMRKVKSGFGTFSTGIWLLTGSCRCGHDEADVHLRPSGQGWAVQ